MKKFKLLILGLFIYLNSFSQFKKQGNYLIFGKHAYLEIDKTLHATIGAFVASNTYLWHYKITENFWFSATTSMVNAFTIGLGKEIYDKSIGHSFSNDDIISTFGGGYTGLFSVGIALDINKKKKYEKTQITP